MLFSLLKKLFGDSNEFTERAKKRLIPVRESVQKGLLSQSIGECVELESTVEEIKMLSEKIIAKLESRQLIKKPSGRKRKSNHVIN
jgi:hypothetical protein